MPFDFRFSLPLELALLFPHLQTIYILLSHLSDFGDLLKEASAKNLPPHLKQIIEELEQFQATFYVYKDRGYEESMHLLVSKVVKRVHKILDVIKNEAILKLVFNKENEEGASSEKIPTVNNWRELLKANLYKITMLTFKEKSQLNNLIQKDMLSKEDIERIITLLSKLKNEELIALFVNIFEDFVKNYVHRNKILSRIIKYKKFHRALNLDLRYIDENYILSEVYKNIRIKVRYMNPEEFKRSYKGSYSHYFNKIKDSHNRYLGIQTVGNLIKLMKKMSYYGVIYKITQVKDKHGHKINDGPTLIVKGKIVQKGCIRIGRAIELYDRLTHYISTSESERAKYHFELALRKYSIKAFRIEILAVCKSKKEYIATEYFWQLYFNRKNNENGFALSLNNYFNPRFGSYEDSMEAYRIPKHEVVRFILQNKEQKWIQKYYGNKYKTVKISNWTINHRFIKYFGTHDIYKIKLMLLKPSLDICFKRGYTIDETLIYLERQGLDYFDKISKITDKREQLRRLVVEIYGDQREGNRNLDRYEAVRSNLFVRLYVEYLESLGFESIIQLKSSKELVIRDKQGRIIGRTEVDMNHWSIIEFLYAKDLSPTEIAVQLGLCKRDDPSEVRNKAIHIIQSYLQSRWRTVLEYAGVKYTINHLKIFLKAHYLGYNMYKNYLSENELIIKNIVLKMGFP